MKTKALLKDLRMKKRYEAIQNYQYNNYRILNPSMGNFVTQNIIQAVSTLEILKDMKAVIESDLSDLKIEKIDMEDIIYNRENELSEYIARDIYLLKMGYLKKDYITYIKAQKLDKIYSEEARRAELKEIEDQIKSFEKSIEVLKELDGDLAKNQMDKLENLKQGKESIEKTLNYKSLDELRSEIYMSTYNHINYILNTVESNITHLERYL